MVKLSTEGFKLLLAGTVIHYMSPNSYGVETPIVVGDSLLTMCGHGVFAAVLALFLLDQLSGPRFAGSMFHAAAGSWLRSSAVYKAEGTDDPDRPTVFITATVRALGEETCFRYGLLTLIPEIGGLPGSEHLGAVDSPGVPRHASQK